MTNDKHFEKQDHKDVDNHIPGAQITKPEDNVVKQRQDMINGLKSYRITKDGNPFTIDLGSGDKVQDVRSSEKIIAAVEQSLLRRHVQTDDKTPAEWNYIQSYEVKLSQLPDKLTPLSGKSDRDVDSKINQDGKHESLGILPVDIAPHLENKTSEEFSDAIKCGIESIPPYVLHYLARGKWSFRLDESISKDDPALAKQDAAGHAEGGGKFGTNFGATDFNKHRIVVAEKADPLNPNGNTYEADRINPHPDETLRHETGHALDAALGMYSHSNEFVNAYNDCLKSLPPADIQKLSYYLQKGYGGPQELFAELFAYLHGGGPNKGEIDSELARAFGPCLQKIKDKEALMKKEYAS